MDSVKGGPKPVSRKAIVLILLAVVAPLLPYASAHDDIESRASLTIQPTSGPAGTTVQADGAQFIPGTTVEIHLDSESGPKLAET